MKKCVSFAVVFCGGLFLLTSFTNLANADCGNKKKIYFITPIKNQVVAEDQTFSVKWKTCKTEDSYTLTLTSTERTWTESWDPTSKKSLDIILDSASVRPGSYKMTVASSDGTQDTSAKFTVTSPYTNRYYDEVFANYTLDSDIVYGQAKQSGETVDLKLDLYQPMGDTGTKRAAIVFVHGGGYTSGSKSSGSNAEYFSKTFALRGYVTASIDYRLWKPGDSGYVSPEHQLKSMYDAKAAVRWMRANAALYGIDENRISIGGSSAGASISNGVAYDDEDGEGDSGNPGYSSEVNSVMSFKGYLSDATLVDSLEPELVNIIGTEDDFYPQASLLNDAVVAAGIHTLFYPIEGGTHTNIKWTTTLQYSVPFFAQWNADFVDSDAANDSITTVITGDATDD